MLYEEAMETILVELEAVYAKNSNKVGLDMCMTARHQIQNKGELSEKIDAWFDKNLNMWGVDAPVYEEEPDLELFEPNPQSGVEVFLSLFRVMYDCK